MLAEETLARSNEWHSLGQGPIKPHHLLHVLLRFGVRRDAVTVFGDRALARVVGGQRQRFVTAEHAKQV